MNPGLSELGGFRRLCVIGGMVLLGLAVVMFIARLAGMLPQGFLAAAGDSGLRPLASLAVGGCLGIAIGFWGK